MNMIVYDNDINQMIVKLKKKLCCALLKFVIFQKTWFFPCLLFFSLCRHAIQMTFFYEYFIGIGTGGGGGEETKTDVLI